MPRGRPVKSNKGPADARIEFRVPEEDKRAFQAAAEAAGKPLSEWIAENLRRIVRSSSTQRRPTKG